MTTTLDSDVEAVPWLDPDQQRCWRAFLAGTSVLKDSLNRQLESASNLTLHEYEILVQLSEAPDRAMRMSTIAQRLFHSRSRVTHTARRLEARGLVRRVACGHDGRGVNCVLTDAGMLAIEEAAPGHVGAVRRHLIDLMSPEEARVLHALMERVAATASRYA